MENIEDKVEELDGIMETLDLGKSSGYSDKGSDENNNHQPAGDFMICCNNTSDKYHRYVKTGLELYEDDQIISQVPAAKSIISIKCSPS
jgi:hypothetical protein